MNLLILLEILLFYSIPILLVFLICLFKQIRSKKSMLLNYLFQLYLASYQYYQ